MSIVKTVKQIEVEDWDDLVRKTYGKFYSFQQQDGCKSRGVEIISTNPNYSNDYKNDKIPEVINGDEMGVSFKAWLERDPKEPVAGRADYGIQLWWDRNFYPDANMIAQDLCKKGLLEPGEYQINIDW